MTTYYVKKTGLDTNPGTNAEPWLTIQKFADVCAAGDTCIVSAGTYRETVTLATSGTSGSRITIQAAAGETVIVSGCDLVTGWTLDSGAIYKKAFGALTNLGPRNTRHDYGDNQMFEDGIMLTAARFPKNNDHFAIVQTDMSYAIGAGSGYAATNYTIIDTVNLTQASDYWVGASCCLTYNQRYCSETGYVTAFNGDTDTLTVKEDTTDSSGDSLTTYGRYYLFGHKNALTQAGEWCLHTDATLYVWCTDGAAPSTHTMEIKQRTAGLAINASYVTVSNIQVFGCDIVLSADSSYCILTGITGKYVSHYGVLQYGNVHDGQYGRETSGIQMKGTQHQIIDSTISWSAGHGIALLGDHCTASGCTVHHVNYMGTECAGIDLGLRWSHDNTASDCTVYTTKRAGINCWSVNGKVLDCDIYDSVCTEWCWDSGAIYGNCSCGVEIARNHIHDPHTDYPNGIYFDGVTADCFVHDNLIEEGMNADNAILFIGTTRAVVINNTVLEEIFMQCHSSDVYPLKRTSEGNRILNNLCSLVTVWIDAVPDTFEAAEGIESNNYEFSGLSEEQKKALFTDYDADDFTLSATSAALDYGVYAAATSTDLSGNSRVGSAAVDAGCYERQG